MQERLISLFKLGREISGELGFFEDWDFLVLRGWVSKLILGHGLLGFHKRRMRAMDFNMLLLLAAVVPFLALESSREQT